MKLSNSIALYLVLILFCWGYFDRATGISLLEGLRFVTKKAKTVNIADTRKDILTMDTAIAKSRQLPQVDVYFRQKWLRYQPEALFGPYGEVPLGEAESKDFGIKVTQLLFDFGRTESIINAAEAHVTVAAARLQAAKNEAALQFTETYIDALQTRRLLEVVSDEVKRFRAHLRDASAMYTEGLVTKNDLLQAEVLLADAEQRKTSVQNLLELIYTKLNILLSRETDAEIHLQEPTYWPEIKISLQDAYQIALKERPELKALQAQITALKHLKKATEAEFLPSIYLAGGFDYSENRFMVHEDNLSLVVAMELKLFSGGAKEARVHKKNAEIKELLYKKQLLIDRIRIQVKDAYVKLSSAVYSLEVAQKALQQARENLRLQRLKYKEGIGTSTEVTDAVAMLSRAEGNYWKALYETLRQKARLYHAMGLSLLELFKKGGENELQ